MNLVSVIVPVYQAHRTLPRCIQSILAQTWQSLELILVDDGSTDGSGDLCDAFACVDPRIKVIHQKNAGVSSARNAALDVAQGQWVVFVDADDALAPTALESAVCAAQQNPNRIVLWPFAETTAELAQTMCDEGTAYPFEKTGWMYLDCCLSMPWNKLFCREMIQAAGEPLRFDPAYSLGEDLLFCLAYCKRAAAMGSAGFFKLREAQTFYETKENQHSLTQSYRQDFCELWIGLFDHLLTDCSSVFQCSDTDLTAIRHSYLCTITDGISDLYKRGSGSPADHKQAALAILRRPEIQMLCWKLRQANRFSPLLLGLQRESPSLLLRMWNLRCSNPDLYGKVEAVGQKLWDLRQPK